MINFLTSNGLSLLDFAEIIIISLLFLRLFLFNWYVQFIVCLYVSYQLYNDGCMKIIKEVSYFTELFRFSNIVIQIISFVKLGFKTIKNLSIKGLIQTLSELFFQKIMNWIKSKIIDTILGYIQSFIKARVMEFVKKKVKKLINNYIKKFINENRSMIIKTIIATISIILLYFISWLFWPLRQIINILLVASIFFSIFYFRENVFIFIKKCNKVLIKYFDERMQKNNGFVQILFYYLLISQIFFFSVIDYFHDEKKFFDFKSVSIQINMVMIGIFPFLFIFRYMTSNILWFLGFLFVIFSNFAVFYVKDQFWFKLIMKIEKLINEFIEFLDSLKDVAEEIKNQVCKIIGIFTRPIIDLCMSFGILSMIHNDETNVKKMEIDEKNEENENKINE